MPSSMLLNPDPLSTRSRFAKQREHAIASSFVHDHAQGACCARIMIAMLSNWRHSGFQVFCGQRILPQDETAMENLARCIIRASFSQERMQYLPEPSKVVYRAKDGTEEKVLDTFDMNLLGKTGDSKNFDMHLFNSVTKSGGYGSGT